MIEKTDNNAVSENINDTYASFDYDAVNTRGGGVKGECTCLKCDRCDKKINSVIKLLKTVIPKYYNRFIQNKPLHKDVLVKPVKKSSVKPVKKSSVKSASKSSVKSASKSSVKPAPKSSVKPAPKSSRKSKKLAGGLFGLEGTSVCDSAKQTDYSITFDENVFNTDNLFSNKEFSVKPIEGVDPSAYTSAF